MFVLVLMDGAQLKNIKRKRTLWSELKGLLFVKSVHGLWLSSITIYSFPNLLPHFFFSLFFFFLVNPMYPAGLEPTTCRPPFHILGRWNCASAIWLQPIVNLFTLPTLSCPSFSLEGFSYIFVVYLGFIHSAFSMSFTTIKKKNILVIVKIRTSL